MANRTARRRAHQAPLYNEYNAFMCMLMLTEAAGKLAAGEIEVRYVKRAGSDEFIEAGFKLHGKETPGKHSSATALTERDMCINAGVHGDLVTPKQVTAVRERVETWDVLTQEIRAELTRNVTPSQLQALPQWAGL